MASDDLQRQMHRDHVQRWKERNPERAKEVAIRAARKYRENNLEKCKKREKLYRGRNKEKLNFAWKNWYAENKEKVRQRDRERRHGSPEAKIKFLLQSAKCRAKKRGTQFDVDFSDISIPTHCPLLGVELVYSGEGMHCPNSASIDRIDSKLGYVKGNVWIISRRANVIKNDASLDELRMILENLEKKIKEIWS